MKYAIRIALTVVACGTLAATMSACGKKGGGFQMPPASVTIGMAVKIDLFKVLV